MQEGDSSEHQEKAEHTSEDESDEGDGDPPMGDTAEGSEEKEEKDEPGGDAMSRTESDMSVQGPTRNIQVLKDLEGK